MAGPDDSLLTTFLTENDHPCPDCGYNLRNLRGDRCPECGEKLLLRVNAAESRQRLLIAGLIGLSAGAGLNGLLLLYGFIQELCGAFGGEDGPFWLATCLGLFIEAVAICVWLKSWRLIRRRTVLTRLALAMCCWLLTLIDLVIFSFTIR